MGKDSTGSSAGLAAAAPKYRILFVDDEVQVLHGLQRLLRAMRHEWEMEFVDSGQAALDALAARPFDVIVTDMRMPGMSGAELLAQVAQRHPSIIRFVLSGQADRETLLASAAYTHQYLGKPCEPGVLTSKVVSALALRDLLDDGSLRTLLAQVRSLPSLPALYVDMLHELQRPEPAIMRLAEVMSRDVGMTAKILQLVNSPVFGISRAITDVQQAVQYLGVDVVRSLTLGLHIFTECTLATEEFDAAALWQHSLVASRVASAIARFDRLDETTTSDVMTAALLHDCGKLLLGMAPRAWIEAHPVPVADGRVAWQVERERFGCGHSEVGAYLLGVWGIPLGVVTAVAFHHRPAACLLAAPVHVAVVHVANVLAHELAGDPTDGILDDEFLAGAGLADRVPAWRDACSHLAAGT